MQRMIVVGAGGLGREVAALAQLDIANGKDWYIGGFLDTRPDVLSVFAAPAEVIGDPRTFEPAPGDIFIVAIGDTRFKRKMVAPLKLRGANFVSLRTRVRMSDRVRYGASVFADGPMMAVDTVIGDFAYIGTETMMGHDVVIGDYAHIGARCFIAGRVHIGEGATVHPMCCIGMDVRVGDGATIGMGSVVLRDVPTGATVLGNPARRIDAKASSW